MGGTVGWRGRLFGLGALFYVPPGMPLQGHLEPSQCSAVNEQTSPGLCRQSVEEVVRDPEKTDVFYSKEPVIDHALGRAQRMLLLLRDRDELASGRQPHPEA